MPELAAVAARALPLIDLTSLSEGDTPGSIEALCRRAVTPAGPVAAVCIYPWFVTDARRALDPRVKLATVVNFPHGTGAMATVTAEARAAIADGAEEIDLVFPYRAFLAGQFAEACNLVAAVKATCGDRMLKVILETGQFADLQAMRDAADRAIDSGADFLKTSTGKTSPGATPEAACVLLDAIAEADRPVGFKAAGGIRSAADAAPYLALADSILGPDWATPATFRFGASGLLDDLLKQLGLGPSAGGAGSY